MTDVWDEDFDSSSSQFYFVHRASKETRWKLPDPTALARQSAEWHGLEDASTLDLQQRMPQPENLGDVRSVVSPRRAKSSCPSLHIRWSLVLSILGARGAPELEQSRMNICMHSGSHE